MIDFRIPDYLLDHGTGLELDLQDFLRTTSEEEFEFILLDGPGKIDSGMYIFERKLFPSSDISDYEVRDVSIKVVSKSGKEAIGSFRLASVWRTSSQWTVPIHLVVSKTLEDFPLQQISISFSEKMIEGRTYLIELSIPKEFSYEFGNEIVRRVRHMYESVIENPKEPEMWLFHKYTGLQNELRVNEWMTFASEFTKPSEYAEFLSRSTVVSAEVSLWAEGFEVVQYSGKGYQTISGGIVGGRSDTKWAWLVTPIVSETHKMHANMNLEVSYSNCPETKNLRTPDIEIDVQESIIHRLKKAFERFEPWIISLLAAVLVPIVILIHKRNLKLRQIRLSDSASRQSRRRPFPKSFYTEKKMRKHHKNHNIVRKH